MAAQGRGPGHVHQGPHGRPRPCSPQNSEPPRSAWAGFWRAREREGTVSLPSSSIHSPLQMEGHSRALSPSRCRSRGGCWSAWSAASVSMAAVRPQQPRPWCHARHSGHTSTPPCGVQASAPGVWDTRAFLCTAFAGVVWVFVLGAGAGACPSGAHTVSGRRAWEEGRSTKAPQARSAGRGPFLGA